MGKKRRKGRRKKLNLSDEKRGEDALSSSSDFVSLQTPNEPPGYFLGFKRKNYNALWDWNTLQDINIDNIWLK